MEKAAYERMKRFFSPRHIAVVGASTRNHWFFNIVGAAMRSGFKGRFYPVNPNASEVCGIPSVPSIADLPAGIIDFAAVIVKSSLVLSTLRELAQRGVRNILLVSSGYSETGEEGARLQEELKGFCRRNDIMLLGPNCLGFINVENGASVFAGGSVEGDLIPGTIGMIGQSGAVSEVIVTKIMKKGLGISLFASTGNEAIITAEDCLEHMIEDGVTKVVIGFMEGFKDTKRLRKIALDAAGKKIPIIFIKVGRSEKGVKAAQSHTGALAGDAGVMEGFFRQYGIIRVETIEELVETAGIFSRCPLPEGGRLGICTFSGGYAGLYADLCARLSIELPDLSPGSVEALKASLPDFAQPGNPLDVTGSGFSSGMDRIVKILLEDEGIDILATVTFPPSGDMDNLSFRFNESFLPVLHSSTKPIVPVTFREVSDYARKYYRDKGTYFIEHAEDGFKAISHFIRYAEFQRSFRMRNNP
jgi:acyl-CoA synthetase (NDP forming)